MYDTALVERKGIRGAGEGSERSERAKLATRWRAEGPPEGGSGRGKVILFRFKYFCL